MDVNNFSIYSKNVNSEILQSNDMENVLNLIKEFDDIYDSDQAKKCLKDKWGIECGINNYGTKANVQLRLKESKDSLKIQFEYDNEKVIYVYSKRKDV